ncbi:MAG: hypothetical protein WAU91_17785, partial [Desulfatitalea sp.]
MDKNLTRRLRAAITIALFAIVWLGVCFGASPDKGAVQGTMPAVFGQSAEATAAPDPDPDLSILERSKVSMPRWVVRMGIDGEAVRLYAKWVVGAPVLVVSILIAMLLRPRGNAESDASEVRSEPVASPRAKGAKRPTPRPKASKGSVKLSDQQQVLRFFLQLFKSQHAAEPDVPAQIVRTETRPTCPNETYEMRILLQEEWVTRRMSIGLLGQGGGSRSKCFYVIYDTHMVIKIPAVPMAKFSDYKRQIEAEGRIVSRLAPRLCIVPRVSVILKAVHSFPQSEHLSEEALEAMYVRLVETTTELQEHLKIDDSFALFMDLAKHYFLSTTLEEIHSGYARLIDEAQQHPELLWDHHAFVCRYGEETGGVCNALQEVYYRCEERLRRLIEEAGIAKTLPTYHLRQWFLLH